MTVLTETTRYGGEFLMTEATGSRSREVVTIPAGAGKLNSGAVLGIVASDGGGIASAAKAGGNTGNGTNGTLSVTSSAKLGVYQVRMTSATAFTVTDPNGATVGTGVAATPFAGGQVVFTITAGGTAFVAGDGFDLTVSAVPLSAVLSPASGSNGSQTAVAVLMYPVDATTEAVKATVIRRDAEVNGNILSYAATVDDAAKRAAKATQLAAVGIIVR